MTSWQKIQEMRAIAMAIAGAFFLLFAGLIGFGIYIMLRAT